MTLDNLDGWMAQAVGLAQQAFKKGEVPVGALVVLNNAIVASASNEKETHFDPTAHAETLAIRAACQKLKNWRLTDAILVSTLEPCPMCLAVAQQARVRAVYFGARDPKGGSLSLDYQLHQDPALNHQFEVYHHPYAAAGTLLTDFFRTRRGQHVK